MVTWSLAADMPTARWGLGVARVGNVIYAIAGSDDVDVGLEIVEAYDPLTDTWTTKASLPVGEGRNSFACVENAGKIHIVNGYGPWTIPHMVYDPVVDTWSSAAAPPWEDEFYPIASLNGLVYYANYGQDPSWHSYDPTTDTWTERAATYPVGFGYGGTAVSVDNKAWMFSSEDYDGSVHVYDPGTNSWEQKTSSPIERGEAAASYLGGGLVLVPFGYGWRPDLNMNSAVPYVEVYDIATDTWTQEADALVARTQGLAASLNGKAYVMGGYGQWPDYELLSAGNNVEADSGFVFVDLGTSTVSIGFEVSDAALDNAVIAPLEAEAITVITSADNPVLQLAIALTSSPVAVMFAVIAQRPAAVLAMIATRSTSFVAGASLEVSTPPVAPPPEAIFVRRVSYVMPAPVLDSRGRPT